MNLYFCKYPGCSLRNNCRFVHVNSIKKAEKKYETIQFLSHSQDRADNGIKKNELIDLRSNHSRDYTHFFEDNKCMRL